MKRLSFIWDMDGTLVDSYPAIVPSVRQACAEFGLHFDDDEIRRQVLQSSVGAFLERLPLADTAPVKERFNALNDSHIEKITAMPHAAQTLSCLTRAGHRCFVYTHRGASCRAILEQTGLLPFFTEIVTALEGFARKPSPVAIEYLMRKYALEPDACFYVGDRSLDVEAAVNAGIGSILLLVPGSPTPVSGRETHVISDLSDMCSMFAPQESTTCTSLS